MVFRKKRRVQPQINMINLIDVVLQLVIFFVLTTTFITNQSGIRVNLPQAQSMMQNVVQESNTIVIAADSTMYLNHQKVRDKEELRKVLRNLRKSSPGDLIVIKADESVAHGVVVGVMDIAKTSGFSKIAIATR